MQKKVILAGAIFISGLLAYNCGGGGGTTSSIPTVSSTSLDVYATDAPPQGLTTFEIPIYKIELCKTQDCEQSNVVFENQNGVSIDLASLEGTLLYLHTAEVEKTQYQAIRVETGATGVGVYNGEVVNIDMSQAQGCSANSGRCIFTVPANVDVNSENDLVVDFNLSGFEVNCDNTQGCTVTKVDLRKKPVNHQQMRVRYEVYGKVQSVDSQNQRLTFEWAGQTFTASISDTTVCEIETQGREIYATGQECLSNLGPGMCLELKLDGDPAQTDVLQSVIKLETSHGKRCGEKLAENEEDEWREIEEHYRGRKSREIKGSLVSIDQQNNAITITLPDGTQETIQLSNNVYCEIDMKKDGMEEEDAHYIGNNCIAQIQDILSQGGIQNVIAKVKFREENGNRIVTEIDIDMENDMDDYGGSDAEEGHTDSSNHNQEV